MVFPDAEKKFYLDADINERTKRRHKEMIEAGLGITFDEVSKDLTNRDRIDSTRAVAPLKKADDAIYIDTTEMTIDEVVNAVLSKIEPNG